MVLKRAYLVNNSIDSNNFRFIMFISSNLCFLHLILFFYFVMPYPRDSNRLNMFLYISAAGSGLGNLSILTLKSADIQETNREKLKFMDIRRLACYLGSFAFNQCCYRSPRGYHE